MIKEHSNSRIQSHTSELCVLCVLCAERVGSHKNRESIMIPRSHVQRTRTLPRTHLPIPHHVPKNQTIEQHPTRTTTRNPHRRYREQHIHDSPPLSIKYVVQRGGKPPGLLRYFVRLYSKSRPLYKLLPVFPESTSHLSTFHL